MQLPRFVGQDLPDPGHAALVQGLGQYVADLHPAGMLEAHFVRSELAHALVLGVDTRPALDVPGVLAAYCAADLARLRGPGACRPQPAAARDAPPAARGRPGALRR